AVRRKVAGRGAALLAGHPRARRPLGGGGRGAQAPGLALAAELAPGGRGRAGLRLGGRRPGRRRGGPAAAAPAPVTVAKPRGGHFDAPRRAGRLRAVSTPVI